MATIATLSTSILPPTFPGLNSSVAIDTLLTESAIEYSWLTSDGNKITLIGAFTYPGGFGSLPVGSVDQLIYDTGNDGTDDLAVDYGSDPLDADDFVTGPGGAANPNSFWEHALSQADTGTISGTVPLTSPLFLATQAFGLDGSLASIAQADIITFTGLGHLAGDSSRGNVSSMSSSNGSAADTLTFNRAATGLSVVTGDHGYIGTTSPSEMITADDFIQDVSTVSGETWLVGDIYDVGNNYTVYAGDDTIIGGGEEVTIIGDVHTMSGSAGGAAAPTVYGGADTLTGGTKDDLIVGDVYEVTESILNIDNFLVAGDDMIDGGQGDDILYGDFFNNTFGAGVIGGHDTLKGSEGDDKLYGQLGNDVLQGGSDENIIDGGEGFDIASYADAKEGVTVDLNLQGDFQAVNSFSFDQLVSIEGVIGSAHNDMLIAAEDIGAVMEGLEGENELVGSAEGFDTASYANAVVGVNVSLELLNTEQDTNISIDRLISIEALLGSAHDDLLSGNGDANSLTGGAGNDDLDGGGGSDSLNGGLGNDEYWIDDANDIVLELAVEGYDRVYADGLTSYTLPDDVERLTFLDTGNHTATGNDLANRFDGNAGNDTFILDAGGNDIFSGGQGQDTFDARAGSLGIDIDLVSGTHGGDAAGDLFASMEVFWGSNNAAVSDTMVTGAARAKFYGFAGDDDLTGGATVDYLDGGIGDDVLDGMGARDGLRGFTGDDTLTGGADRDYFQYVFAGFDHDTITDYQDGLDYLRVFSAVADEVSDFIIIGNGTSSVLLTLDDGTTDNTITLNGDGGSIVTIDASDFLFY
ncbi:calcium-binding protein [Pseudahrensia aquimaris]|uniref:Calcium-binding protein n=1 Tax=Pseudahrensia aquimaris TaxID=744461 RepID=A0ABW3FHR8_9HYPH